MSDLQSMAYAPDTLREYETIYILRPETVSEQVSEVNNRVRGIIETAGGKVVKVDNWGRRRLAYEIRKQLKGIYLYWQYLGSPEIVAEFERNLRMLDPVIRYMTVRLDENVDPNARPSDVTDEDFERAAVTAIDEPDEPEDEHGDDYDADADSDDDDDDDSDGDDSAAADSDDDGDSDDSDSDSDDSDSDDSDSDSDSEEE